MKGKMLDMGLDFLNSKAAQKRQICLQPSYDKKDKNGDKVTIEIIDTIKNFPEKDVLFISKLKDDNFEYLAKTYGKQFKFVTLWHCQRISSLKPIEYFENLQIFVGNWNQLANSFWDFNKTPNITAMSLDGYSKIHDLSPLVELQGLREFIYQMGMHNNKSVVDSILPLTKLTSLEYLSIRTDKIADKDITPLANIVGLKELDIPTNLFTLPQYAWLKNKIGGKIKCDIFDLKDYDLTISILGGDTSVYTKQMVLGAGKRSGKKYDEEIAAALDWFAKHPNAKPEDYPN